MDCQDDDGMYATQVACRSCVNDNQIKAADGFKMYPRRALNLKYDRMKHQGVLEEVLGLSSASSTLPALERSTRSINVYARDKFVPHWVVSSSQKAFGRGAAAEPEPSLRSADPPSSVATDCGMFSVSSPGARAGGQAYSLEASAGALLLLSRGSSADESLSGYGSGVGQGGLIGMDPAQLAQIVEHAGRQPSRGRILKIRP